MRWSLVLLAILIYDTNSIQKVVLQDGAAEILYRESEATFLPLVICHACVRRRLLYEASERLPLVCRKVYLNRSNRGAVTARGAAERSDCSNAPTLALSGQ